MRSTHRPDDATPPELDRSARDLTDHDLDERDLRAGGLRAGGLRAGGLRATGAWRGRGVASVVLGVLLAAMAAGQLSDLPAFVELIGTYEVGGRTLSWLLAVALLAGQLLGATGLLASHRPDRLRRVGAVAALATALGWSALAVQAFARGLVLENCGCFGVWLPQSLSWRVLLQDVYFVALGVMALRAASRGSPAGHDAAARDDAPDDDAPDDDAAARDDEPAALDATAGDAASTPARAPSG